MEGPPPAGRAADFLDRRQLVTLLKLYARLTLRGRSTRRLVRGQGSPWRAFLMLGLVYGLLGFGLGTVATFGHPPVFTYALVCQAMTFFVTGLALAAEAGDILFNRSEADILGPRPVGARTLLAAKGLNCLAYALVLALIVNAAPTFMGLACSDARRYYPLVHVLVACVTTLTAASLVVLVYAALSRVVSAERLEDVMSWSQVVMSVVFMLSYQVVPRVLERFGRDGMFVSPETGWVLVTPPAWLAALEAALASSHPVPRELLLGGLALAAAIALPALAVGRLARGHDDVLSRVREAPGAVEQPRRAGSRSRLADRLLSIPLVAQWVAHPAERASFRLAVTYFLRDRELRTRLYPQLVLLVIFPVLAWLSAGHGQAVFLLAVCLVFLATFPIAALDFARRSPQFAAADVFMAAPLVGPGRLFMGVRKAAILLFVPAAGCLTVPLLALAMGQWRLIVPMVAAAVAVIPAVTLVPGAFAQYVPLSLPVARGEQSAKRVIQGLLNLLTVGAVMGSVVLMRGNPWQWAVVAGAVALSGLAWLALRPLVLSRRWER